MAKIKTDYTLISGAARSRDFFSASIRNKKYEAQELAHSYFVGLTGDKWSNEGKAKWDTQAMCVVKKPSERMLAISEDGDVLTYVGGKPTEEKIPDVAVSTLNLGVIDGYAYACGVWRQVFKRTGEGKWEPMHAPSSKTKSGGGADFLSIAGFSSKDIYAVGLLGDIWHYNGKKWRQIASPVKTALNAVVCAGDGQVYACGDEGVIVVGRDDEWKVIETDSKGTYWDAHWFNGRLYLATLMRLVEYTKEEGLQPVKYGLKGGKDFPKTCYRLTSAEGVMWSVGSQDIFSFDGKKWTRIE